MKISDFTATADLVGRRVRIAWTFEPEAGETLADVPPVALRRKLHDYAFPPPPGGPDPDPWLVYDTNHFPPAPGPGVAISDLPSWEEIDDGTRTVFEPISVATSFGGRMIETLRRTTATVVDPTGVAVRQRVEIVDMGGAPGALLPSTVYYYQLFSNGLPAEGDEAAALRGAALVTNSFGINKTLYESLPPIYRRHDATARPETPGTEFVPEASPRGGQLRRFTDLFGIALDSLRGTAEGLRTLHDLDEVDARYLPRLAHWLGWDLATDVEIPLLRNELKSAGRLYKLVGTVPGLRALVSRYTGWFTQIAEFQQNIARANRPAQRGVFAVLESGANLYGAADAAEPLGFAPSASAVGGGGLAASLTGGALEPFNLPPGAELTIAIDGLAPATVRFGNDFADATKATAAEVALAIGRASPELRADVQAGRVRLCSRSIGASSQVQIVSDPASLVTPESAPQGRLSPAVDKSGRLRLFYECWETTALPEAGAPLGGAARSAAKRRVRYKTLADGVWRDAHSLDEASLTPQGDPAATVLPDDRPWAAWIDEPQTAHARVRAAVGAARPAQPARIVGLRAGRFRLVPGAVMALGGDFAGTETFTVIQADYVDVTMATAAEVALAMNAQLSKVKATPEKNGTLRIETVDAGPRARLFVDLRKSTAAIALGFDRRNAAGAGSWDEVIDWSAPIGVTTLPPGSYAELCATPSTDAAGGVRLTYATHTGSSFSVASVRWDERTLAATSAGLSVRVGAGPWKTLGLPDGLPSVDVRAAVIDEGGVLWIATAAGVAMRLPSGATTTFTTVSGLPSNDVRAIAIAPDGTVWFATAAGAGLRRPDGTFGTLLVAGGLPSNDVRAIAIAPDGTVWFATAAGAAVRRPDGQLTAFGIAEGLPSLDVRAAATGGAGAVLLGTANGLAVGAAAGGFVVYGVAAGLPSADIRAVVLDVDDLAWVGTARGVTAIDRARSVVVRSASAASGLASDDVRAIAAAPDGALWIATPAGIDVRARSGAITHIGAGSGLASNAVRAIGGWWSPPRMIANGGGSNREPCAVVDEQQRTWVIWSQRVGFGTDVDGWVLRARIFAPATFTWGPEIALTTQPVGGRAADRTPGAMPVAGGVRVFFSSDRAGGTGLYWITVPLAGGATLPSPLPSRPAADTSPSPITIGGKTWVLFRSDANVSPSHAAPLSPGARGGRVPDAGTLRRAAGTTAYVPTDLQRARRSRLFGDLLSYTPQKPLGPIEPPLRDDELYTRGTLGLYVSRGASNDPITPAEAARLRELLARFLPLNLRAVVVIVPSIDVDVVYPDDAEIDEEWQDEYPFADTLAALSDESAADLPEWEVLLASDKEHVSADPADLKTLRRRTHFPPPK
ncbi:two-component regulator propeller domain-containing protein [Sorangium sp. So ce1000]|uniref:two-component regulator propeller domain-containing protein n=1 Tax=Sorangium sp. So ce1000 TaxID=3133325 RepID=UPI003F63BC5F